MKLPPAFKDWTEAERRLARVLLQESLGLLIDSQDVMPSPARAGTIAELRLALDVPAPVAASEVST